MSRDGIRPYDAPAGGWDALAATGRVVREQGAPATSTRALLRANQPDGFDCPGCAWPDPKHTSSFEFCENGAKAVAWETTSRTIGTEFFARHTVAELRAQTDHWLESQGRLAAPLRYDRASDRYVPIPWDAAFALIGAHLRGLPSPDAAAFYTSGRTSNEAAFLYQLFAREFGTNNLPDCSNLCHEATSVGLPESIGVGKGTVQLEDFERTALILSFGHNPGTNHPRMLATLRAAAKRGVPLLVFNPLRERGLERFRSPQDPVEMLTGGATELATHYFQPRIGSDTQVLQGLMKRVLELGAVDREFVAAHTTGFDALAAQLEALDWDALCSSTGLTREQFDLAGGLYAAAPSAIAAYGMGITQHAHGTQNVQQIANLLLLRGNVGRPGAGICPVRGHSNVQGDRTMGINERPPAQFLDRLRATCGFEPPRAHGVTVIECIAAIEAGRIRALVERVVPGFERYNERIREPGRFHLPNAAALRTWRTASGRAQFQLATRAAPRHDAARPLLLTTIRSHDQYNTTIYGLDDRYRGIRGRRDVVFMHGMAARGLATGDAIELVGAARNATGFVAVEYPIARGSCAAYFPEASVLVALEDFDPASRTPAYKSVPVEVRKG